MCFFSTNTTKININETVLFFSASFFIVCGYYSFKKELGSFASYSLPWNVNYFNHSLFFCCTKKNGGEEEEDEDKLAKLKTERTKKKQK